jgi:CubicO group peptidase (beta-lactamase class C family)
MTDARAGTLRWLTVALVAAALAAALAAGPAAGRAAAPPECAAPKVARGDACVAKARVARQVTAIVRRAMRAERQKAVIYSVRIDGRDVVTAAEGESMTGVPATPAMSWRIGSIAFAMLGTLALQLQEDGVVDLDAPIARWRPELPHADRVTLRMLLNGTSGYQDYVSDPRFLKAVLANPFRQFTEAQLLADAFRRPPQCAPGGCWNYSHANFVIAQQILAQAAGAPFATLLERRVLRPAGLRRTRSATTPQIPSPVLHAFTTQDGVYQDSTFWNPSWTTGRGAVLTSTIRDVVRAAGVIGSGRLLTPASYAELVAPTTATLAPWSARNHYGLGVFSINSWLIQNPSFFGYAGAMGYLPGRRISIAVTSTQLRGADPDANVANTILERIATHLAPGTPPR